MKSDARRSSGPRGLHVISLSVHGLVRARDMELGRDADTGGQVAYVVDQARALARLEEVERVDLVTRQVRDHRVDDSYAEPREEISDKARIVRLPFGPKRYLRKETLWPYLPSLVDQIMRYIRSQGRAPDLVHGHYADAGFVGAQVAKILGVPFLFTGHSLGRIKKARLMAKGQDEETLEEKYHFTQRIEAEEGALETAAVVIASTRQEVQEQYELYDHYEPERMEVIPPGVDVSRFAPPPEPAEDGGTVSRELARRVNRFLDDPEKPLVMAMARPDERKNLTSLLEAFGTLPELREKANLLIIAGNREDIRKMEPGSRKVLTEILLLMDRYDLYGSVSIPKHHTPEEVPGLYRMAAESGGVFVNPALTEPFGLTLIEAAASGLPIVATNDGGPRDIVAACENGLLVDPMDTGEIATSIVHALADRDRWERWAESGVRGVHESFTWESHANRYLEVVRDALGGLPTEARVRALFRRSRLPRMDRLLVTDIDNTLTGNREGLEAFLHRIEEAGNRVGMAVATGRPLPLALDALNDLGLPIPDILITATGTEIHYGQPLVPDRSWRRQIDYHWDREGVKETMLALKGIEFLDDQPVTPYRLRFRLFGRDAPGLRDIRRALRSAGLRVLPTVDHETEVDITPMRASPGLAIGFLSHKWSLAPRRILVAGDSGNDADMLTGQTLGVVVKNHTPELDTLKGKPRVYFSDQEHAWGILDGIEHYDFFGDIRVPEATEYTPQTDLIPALDSE